MVDAGDFFHFRFSNLKLKEGAWMMLIVEDYFCWLIQHPVLELEAHMHTRLIQVQRNLIFLDKARVTSAATHLDYGLTFI